MANSEFVFSLPDPDNVDQSISGDTQLSSKGDIVNEYKGDSRGYGFQLGVSYRLGLQALLGFSFRSQIVSEDKGKLRRSDGTTVTSVDASTTRKTPSIFNLGASYLVARGFRSSPMLPTAFGVLMSLCISMWMMRITKGI